MRSREQNKIWREARKLKGLCLQCSAKAVVGKTLCEECAIRYAMLNRARESKYRENSQCVKCAQPTLPSKTHCEVCATKSAIRAAVQKLEDPRVNMVNSAKRRALIRGLPFNLTTADFEIPATCPVLGVLLKVGVTKQGPYSPTLDRVIPHRGYVRGNVRVISWRANNLRRDASADELEAVARYARWAESQTIEVENKASDDPFPGVDSLLDPTVTKDQIREAMESDDDLSMTFNVQPSVRDLLAPLD